MLLLSTLLMLVFFSPWPVCWAESKQKVLSENVKNVSQHLDPCACPQSGIDCQSAVPPDVDNLSSDADSFVIHNDYKSKANRGLDNELGPKICYLVPDAPEDRVFDNDRDDDIDPHGHDDDDNGDDHRPDDHDRHARPGPGTAPYQPMVDAFRAEDVELNLGDRDDQDGDNAAAMDIGRYIQRIVTNSMVADDSTREHFIVGQDCQASARTIIITEHSPTNGDLFTIKLCPHSTLIIENFDRRFGRLNLKAFKSLASVQRIADITHFQDGIETLNLGNNQRVQLIGDIQSTRHLTDSNLVLSIPVEEVVHHQVTDLNVGDLPLHYCLVAILWCIWAVYHYATEHYIKHMKMEFKIDEMHQISKNMDYPPTSLRVNVTLIPDPFSNYLDDGMTVSESQNSLCQEPERRRRYSIASRSEDHDDYNDEDEVVYLDAPTEGSDYELF